MENQETLNSEPVINTNKGLLMNALSTGLIISGVFILLTILYYVLDINMMAILSSVLMFLVNVLIMAIALTYTMKKFRDKINGGKTTYAKSLFSGWIAGFIGLAISGIFSFLFFHFFAPDYWPEQMAKFMEQMSEQGIPQEQLDEISARITSQFEPLKQLAGTAMNSVIFSGILSLIIAAFVRKGEKLPDSL